MQCRICIENHSSNRIVLITLFLILSLSCNDSKRPTVANNQKKAKENVLIQIKDQEKLWYFIEDKNALPVLTIDSITAVDSLKVSPASYHQLKESLRWKKAYPVEDFLKLRAYVMDLGNFFVLTIDSITAVDSLKAHPQAYSDLKDNIQDCNKVFDYNK